MRPLLLAPRPKAGEALSSWVRRLAARYDASPLAFMAAVGGAVETGALGSLDDLLDRPARPGVDNGLAHATRLDPAAVAALRPIARPEHGRWLRRYPAWCPACLEEDMACEGEIHLRAAWRTGACAVCGRHGTPLRSAAGWFLSWDEAFGATLSVVDGRLRLVLGFREASAVPWWVFLGMAGADGAGAAREAEGLDRVLELQAALGSVLAGREPRDGWTGVVPPAALPAACALILGALDATGRAPGEQPVHRQCDLLAGCAAVLGVLSRRRATAVGTVTARPVWLAPAAADLVDLVRLAPALMEHLTAGAAAIGGSFATAAARAVAWVHLVELTRRVPRQGCPADPDSWPAVLLANPEVVRQLDGLEGHRRALGLDYLARKTLADARRACIETGAARPETR